MKSCAPASSECGGKFNASEMFRLEEDSNDGERGKLAFTGGVASVQLDHGLKDLPDVSFVGGCVIQDHVDNFHARASRSGPAMSQMIGNLIPNRPASGPRGGRFSDRRCHRSPVSPQTSHHLMVYTNKDFDVFKDPLWSPESGEVARPAATRAHIESATAHR